MRDDIKEDKIKHKINLHVDKRKFLEILQKVMDIEILGDIMSAEVYGRAYSYNEFIDLDITTVTEDRIHLLEVEEKE